MGDGPLAVLIGPPGAGKSTVGALLADLLGVSFRDTDSDVEVVAGKPVGDIFVQDGEPAFRALERDAVRAAMSEHRGVLALGGGAVLDPPAQALLSGHNVVYLEASLQALVHRNGLDRPRPLLIGNPRAQLKTLLAARLPVYERLATVTVPTDDYAPEEIADEIAGKNQRSGRRRALTVISRIQVGGADGAVPYPVVIGAGVLSELPRLVGPGAHAVALIHAAGLGEIARPVHAALAAAGFVVHPHAVPGDEAAKEISVASALWSAFASDRISRSDAVVAVGGGAVTDLAGFVAATWLRGVRVVLLPTTLLAMVDAAIGGKTAVNIPAGKNLVGSFHPPAGVLCDLTTLVSLPRPEYASGLAEVIKAGFVADPAILDLIEEDPEAACSPDGPHTRELVERAVRMKAHVVSADLREAGLREILNYGHTLGHAIEKVENYRFRHGEAVSIGLVYAAALARMTGRLDRGTAARHASLLAAVGLPTAYRRRAWPQLRAAMAVDKKVRGPRLRLVVLDGLARPGVLENPPERLLTAAYAEVSAL